MAGKKTNRNSPVGYDPQEEQEARTQACLQRLIDTRPKAEGVTIDPSRTQLIDDGIWIEKNQASGGWTVKTYIADVPAFLPTDSVLAKAAKEQFKDPQQILKQKTDHQIRNFPQSFLEKFVSLHQGMTRPVVAFTMELTEDGALTSYTIDRKVFTNLRKCNHSPLQTQYRPLMPVANEWYGLAHKMLASRLNRMAEECNRLADPEAPRLNIRTKLQKPQHPSELLVQELMRLTNAVAADYMMKHKLSMPLKLQPFYAEKVFSSRDRVFDEATDARCGAIMKDYSAGKPPKIRLSSPMRIYGDYIAIQILTRHLDGLKESPELAREARRLTNVFQEAAAKKHQPDGHMRREKFQQRKNDHPFNYVEKCFADRQSFDLKTMRQKNGWPMPDVAIRKLYVQGGQLFMVGVQQKVSTGRDGAVQSWGVGISYEEAREQASHRVLEDLKRQGHRYCPVAKAGPKHDR